MNFDGLFGKYEMEDVAKRIIKQCEELGTWNVCFQVPDTHNDIGPHVGFTWLIMAGYLNPVPSLSYMWCVNKRFIKRIKEKYISDKLKMKLDKNHGLRLLDNGPLPGKILKGPPEPL